jgi:hypothetical protein
MPIYKWEGKTAKGALKKGEMEGYPNPPSTTEYHPDQDQFQSERHQYSFAFLQAKSATAIGRCFYATVGHHDRCGTTLGPIPGSSFFSARK